MPLPRGCITGAEGCVLLVDAVGVGPPLEKPIAISRRNCTLYAFTLAPSGHLTDTAGMDGKAHEFLSGLITL